MSQLYGSNQQSICGDSKCPGPSCGGCQAFRESEKIHASIQCPHKAQSCCGDNLCDKCFEEQLQTRRGAVGGGSASDVVSLQEFNLDSSGPKCDKCHQQEGSNPACSERATEVPPFTKADVKQLYDEFNSEFCLSEKLRSSNGRMFELVVLLHSLLIPSIDWTMHNCAFSTLVLMLASSNAGLNSINQQTFAGYILAFIINRLQESGKCDPILLEVFRLELLILSGNLSWSNWSELVEFQNLYNLCVKHNVIFDNEVEAVLPDDYGFYNVKQTLNGKCRSTLVEAYKWVPSTNVLVNGILSDDLNLKFNISAVILYKNNHFSIVVFGKGIWLVDGKGNRKGEFKAESSIQELTIEQFQELCASHGAFYFLEKIPLVYQTIHLFGRQGLPPRNVFYNKKSHFLYDDGTMICEKTLTRVNLKRSVFVNDNSGNNFRVFPPHPPPAPCVQVGWVPPPPPPAPCSQYGWVPPPPPPAPCVQVGWVPPPPPPALCAQYGWVPPPPPPAPCVQVAWALPPPPAQYTSVARVPQRSAPISKAQSKSNITVDDIQFHSTRWSCSGKSYSGLIEKLPFNQEVYLFETQRFTDPQKLVEFLNFCESVN